MTVPVTHGCAGAGRTMSLAQQLYEAGHITYMRTDGVSLAPTALAELRASIGKEFGAECLPGEPRMYKARSKNAQVRGMQFGE